jgi:hypothetical protein
MRLYGALTELTFLVIRLASGKNLKIKTDTQTASAADVEVNIPDVGGASTPAFLMVDTVTAQPIRGKTVDFTQNTVTDASLNISKLTAPSGVGDEVIKINQATGVIESGKIKNANIAADAAIVDTKLATISTAGKVETGAVAAVAGLPGRVLTFSDAGVSSVAKIVNANVADNADISGSKLADGTVGVAKITAADTTGTGNLVRASSPTITTPSIAQINTPAQSLTVSGTGALKLPAGLASERPGTPVEGMLRYNSETDSFEGYAAGAWAGIGGGGTTDKVNQVGHNFVVGDVLYLVSSTYVKAIASAANTAEVVGVVSRVLDADNFEMTLSGEVSGLSGLVAGEVYFLSASTAGLLTVTEPSVVGQVSLPVGVASSTTTLYVAPKRGVVVGAANARTTIAVSNNAATNVVSVTDYNSLKLEGELNVTRSSGGNQRAYYTVEAAKNGAGVWQVSASYTGDDVNVGGTTALPSWDVAANNLQITMPLIPTNTFLSASLTYSLNAPAVGASLPLSVDSSSLNIVADAPLSYRNRIINGDMRIDQRNAGTLNNSSQTQYHVDRWNFLGTQVSKFSIQKSATAPSGFTSSLLFTSLAATTAGASDWWAVRQVIEGFNVADLGWGTADAKAITISFWARSSLTGVFGGSLLNDAANRTYAFTYSISAANTWEYKTVTIPGDTSGTWLTDANAGIRLVFGLGAGASAKTAAGSWTAGAFWGGATGTVDLTATNGSTLYLTGVQLEVGSKASAFERRPYGMELALCQRYYEMGEYTFAVTNNLGSTLSGHFINFKVEKRGTPTIVATDIVGNANRYSNYNRSSFARTDNFGGVTVWGAAVRTTAGFIISANTTTSGEMFNPAGLYTASAEL